MWSDDLPSAEVCDGFDNDCDDSIDESLDLPTFCGIGECLAEGVIACEDGETQPDTCLAGDPSDEICDGLDNDCDDGIDEELDVVTFCGVGECGSTGVIACVGGVEQGDTCAPNAPGTEVCDSLDNDCDGSTDENLDSVIFCGVGECSTTGLSACVAGVIEIDECIPGLPTPKSVTRSTTTATT